MRIRTLLIGSLALNGVLAVLWLAGRSEVAPPPPAEAELRPPAPVPAPANIVVRRQFFTWAELESQDYDQYIENLRSIHCPEQTIRDLIVADVDQLFAKRRKTEAFPTTRQWWQSRVDPELLQVAEGQRSALEQERRGLLDRLLGPGWEASAAEETLIVALKVPLDGPVLGSLTAATQEAIQAASGRAQVQFERMLAANPDSPDPSLLAALERQLRSELTPLLSPPQLEEFMLRYSPTAQGLRSDLAAIPLFTPTSSEERTLFRNAQRIDLQLMDLVGEGPAVEAQREALLREREIAFQNALGPERYREYQRLQDPAYARAIAAAQAAGLTNAADLFYALDRLGSVEKSRIQQDNALTPLQQELALRQLALEQLQITAEVVGQSTATEPPPPPPQRTYTFQKEDTIADVSRRTGVPVNLILRANPDLRLGQIPTGTRIVIPEWTSPFQQ